MLILSLKVGEKLRIGTNIVIEIEKTYKIREIKYVKLEIVAPREISIYRDELHQQIFGKRIN
tara:strand:- start:1611 stop:1796 length:186 start_codon:yes stop_codon:yes gene_type:complete